VISKWIDFEGDSDRNTMKTLFVHALQIKPGLFSC